MYGFNVVECGTFQQCATLNAIQMNTVNPEISYF